MWIFVIVICQNQLVLYFKSNTTQITRVEIRLSHVLQSQARLTHNLDVPVTHKTNIYRHAEIEMRGHTNRTTHHLVKLVLVETLVDCAAASLHIATESLSVIAACQEQLTIFVVVISLQLRHTQQLQFALRRETGHVIRQARQSQSLAVQLRKHTYKHKHTETCQTLAYNHSTPPQPFYGPFSRTTQVSRCQKTTSGVYGAREDQQRTTHRPSSWATLHQD